MTDSTNNHNAHLRRLKLLAHDAQEWANSVPHFGEDGWQMDFPKWSDLISAAETAQLTSNLTDSEFKCLELAWEWSEEPETLREFSVDHLQNDACVENLLRLANSDSPIVRWQVYAALEKAGETALPTLLSALMDPNAYCRRIALMSLSQVSPPSVIAVLPTFFADPDPYVRLSAVSAASNLRSNPDVRSMLDRLDNDPVDFVRRAVLEVRRNSS